MAETFHTCDIIIEGGREGGRKEEEGGREEGGRREGGREGGGGREGEGGREGGREGRDDCYTYYSDGTRYTDQQ